MPHRMRSTWESRSPTGTRLPRRPPRGASRTLRSAPAAFGQRRVAWRPSIAAEQDGRRKGHGREKGKQPAGRTARCRHGSHEPGRCGGRPRPRRSRRRPVGSSPLPAAGHLRSRRRHRRHARRGERLQGVRHGVGGQGRERARHQTAGRSMRPASAPLLRVPDHPPKHMIWYSASSRSRTCHLLRSMPYSCSIRRMRYSSVLR